MSRKNAPQPPADRRRPAIVLQLEPHKFAVAVWRWDEEGVAVYAIVNEDIREVKLAATLARGVEQGTSRTT